MPCGREGEFLEEREKEVRRDLVHKKYASSGENYGARMRDE